MDRYPSVRERRHVGERRQVAQRVGGQGLGSLLLLRGDTVDAGEVDRRRRVPGAWPGHGGGLGLVVGVVVGVRGGCRLGAVRVLGGFLRRRLRGVAVRAVVGRDVLGVRVPASLIVAVHVRGAGHHRHQAERAEGDAGRDEVAAPDGRGVPDEGDGGGHDGERSEPGAHGVGEPRRLGLLEPVDPRDPGRARDDPGGDGAGVDEHRGAGSDSTAPQQQHHPDEDLRGRGQHEQPRQGRVLGVDPGRGGVDRTGAD